MGSMKTAILITSLALFLSSPSFSQDILQIEGTVELEQYFTRTQSITERDLILSTVALAFLAQPNNQTKIMVSILYEEGYTPLEIDEAFISYSLQNLPIEWLAGQIYLPFGNYHTAAINDPLTLQFAENRATSLGLWYRKNSWEMATFAYTTEANNAQGSLSNFLVRVGKTWEIDETHLAIGVDMTNNLLQGDGFDDFTDFKIEKLNGANIYLHWFSEKMFVHLEYVGSLEKGCFCTAQQTDVFQNYSSWHTEFGWFGHLLSKEIVTAFSIQGSHHLEVMELPKTRYLFSSSIEINENLALAIEFSHDRNIGYFADDQTDYANSDSLQIQLSAYF